MNKVRYKINSPSKIGTRIYKCRTDFKLTQEQLSEYIGCTPNYIGQLERGTKRLSLSMAERLCVFFGISYDFLLLGKHESNCEQFDNSQDDILHLMSQCSSKEKELFLQVIRGLLVFVRGCKIE